MTAKTTDISLELFLDDLLMFYQAFGVNLMCYVFAGGACASNRDCASIRTYMVSAPDWIQTTDTQI